MAYKIDAISYQAGYVDFSHETSPSLVEAALPRYSYKKMEKPDKMLAQNMNKKSIRKMSTASSL